MNNAFDNLYMGLSKPIDKSPKIELYKTAVHESGHALMSLLHPNPTQKLHKVTIKAKGNSLGHNFSLWMQESDEVRKSVLLNNILSLVGGRAAEEVVFGNKCITTGPLQSYCLL